MTTFAGGAIDRVVRKTVLKEPKPNRRRPKAAAEYYQPDDLLSANAVARLANITSQTVVNETRRGRLPAKRVAGGNYHVFRYADVETWLSQREEAAAQSAMPPRSAGGAK